MSKLKDFLSDKSYGFYVTLVAIAMTVATAIVYAVSYGHDLDMSWWAFALLVVGAFINVVLIFLKQNFWGSILMALCDFLAVLIFIYPVYFYLSVVAYGINDSAFSPAFTSSTTMLVLTLIISIASTFMRQRKEKKAA